jgi:hypothetical protein
MYSLFTSDSSKLYIHTMNDSLCTHNEKREVEEQSLLNITGFIKTQTYLHSLFLIYNYIDCALN